MSQTQPNAECHKHDRIKNVTNTTRYGMSQLQMDTVCHKYDRLRNVTNSNTECLKYNRTLNVHIRQDTECQKYNCQIQPNTECDKENQIQIVTNIGHKSYQKVQRGGVQGFLDISFVARKFFFSALNDV